jgi:hypothetical protein
MNLIRQLLHDVLHEQLVTDPSQFEEELPDIKTHIAAPLASPNFDLL